MRKILTRISTLAVVAGLLLPGPAMASGPELTLRVEPGLAVPFTKPQTDRYGVGGALALKPTLGLRPWFDVNLTLSGIGLSSKTSGVDYGQVLGAGLGFRFKRPHDASNEGRGWSAISPWIDADTQYVRTGALDRFAWSAGVGASVPTSDSRSVWVGPFVRYVNVLNSVNNRPNFDKSDAQILVLGLSFEFGGGVEGKKTVILYPAPVPVQKPVQDPPVVEPPPVTPDPVTLTIDAKIQFPFDSSTPLPASNDALSMVLKELLSHPGYTVQVEGHASSEGQVAHNEKLAERRAKHVADYLVANGVPVGSLTVKGFGSRVPVASNETEVGRSANRRVEFNVSLTLVKKEGTK